MLIQKRTIGTCAIMGGVASVPIEFAWSLAQMVQYSTEFLCQPGQIIHLLKAQTSYHTMARNQLAASFLGDWLFMTDSDHSFAPDLLARLVAVFNEYDLDVLTGLYHYRVAPYLPVAYHWDEASQQYQMIGNIDKSKVLIKIPCAGAGCLLIRRRVFQKIREELPEEKPFDIIHPWSEDFSFFRRLEKLSIPAYLCPQIESFHLTTRMISSDDTNLEGLQLAAIGTLSA